MSKMRNIIEEQSVVRRRVFKVRGHAEIVEVVEILEQERFTGSMALHMSQGTCAAATVEERATIPLTTKPD